MTFLFALLGFCSLAVGIITVATIRSDIQIQIVVTLVLGGLILLGISVILRRLDKRQHQQNDEQNRGFERTRS